MTIVQPSSHGADNILATLVAGLEHEFGNGADEGLAAWFIAAEESDFVWCARRQERWLGAYESLDEEEGALDRVAVIGCLDGHWYVAICLVDGDGMAHGLMGRLRFGRAAQARKAFARQR